MIVQRKNIESSQKCRNKNIEKYKQNEKETKAKLRDKRILEGKCVKCGKEKEKDKFKTCKSCRQKRRNIYLKTELKSSIPKRALRNYLELCSICGKDERIKEKKVCKKCYDVLVKNANYARSFIDLENHKWRKEEEVSYKKYVSQNGGCKNEK